jgi:hypothetical protein
MTRLTLIFSFFAVLTATSLSLAEPDFPGQRAAGDLRSAGFRPLFDGKSFDGWELKPWHEGHFTIREGGVMHYDGKAEGKRGQDKNLWTTEAFGDFTFYAEWRLPREPVMKGQPIVLYNGDFLMEEDNPKKRVTRLRLDAGDSGFYFRGSKKCQANIWSQELGSGEINSYRTDKTMPPEVRRACIPIRNADRPFGEWNAFEITIKGNRMTVVLNGEKVIDAVPLPDLPAEGPIAVQHHGDPVEFRMLWVKELDSQKEKSKTQKK